MIYLFFQMLILAPDSKRNYALFAIVAVTFTAFAFLAFRVGLQQMLLHIPGTPSSVATCFDGHPMVQKGQAALTALSLPKRRITQRSAARCSC